MEAFHLPALEATVDWNVDVPTAAVPAGPTPADLLAAAEAQCVELRAAAVADGLAEGRALAGQELAPALSALRAAAEALGDERDAVAAHVEGAAVELALRIAEQALAGALAVEPERVVDVVRGGLRRLVARERVLVLVAPEDLECVRDAAPALLAELGGMEHLEVQAERRVGRGGAVLRTAEGEVDATLATKLAQARDAVVASLAPAAEPEPEEEPDAAGPGLFPALGTLPAPGLEP